MKKRKIQGVYLNVAVGDGLLTAKAYRRMLVKDVCAVITDEADDLLLNCDFMEHKNLALIELILVSGKELGFMERYNILQLRKLANEWGFLPCSHDIATQLCKQMDFDADVAIAMSPVKNSHGKLKIFEVVKRDGVRWLKTLPANRDFLFPIETTWALIVPEAKM